MPTSSTWARRVPIPAPRRSRNRCRRPDSDPPPRARSRLDPPADPDPAGGATSHLIDLFGVASSVCEVELNAPADYIALSLPSNPLYLGLLREVVCTACDLFDFTEEEKQGLMLAVNEGCANIIEHCYRMDMEKKIVVELRVRSDRMEVKLRDYGQFREILPCSEGPLDEPRGLGIRLMRSVMDEVVYRPAGRKGTLLTMVKYRSQA